MNSLIQDHQELVQYLRDHGFVLPSFPSNLTAKNNSGEAFAIAYPIQGLLKYHGLANPEHRIAFIPSISVNNDVAYTVSYVRMDPNSIRDRFFLNGCEQKGQEFIRIQTQLNYIRHYSKSDSKFLIISNNVMKTSQRIVTGKGLGTSASGGAAIARAVTSILYQDVPEMIENSSIGCLFARYLAGSATRSYVGGLGLWLNHPQMTPYESLALRIDQSKDQAFLSNLDLITISLSSKIKTDQIHAIAPFSPFFEGWLSTRKCQIMEFLQALDTHDFRKLGQITEFDTLCLHSITMTASKSERTILWTPETLQIIKLVQEMSNSGIPLYFSIDTGPSVVILIETKNTGALINELQKNFPFIDVSIGKIGGPAKNINPNSPETKEIHSILEKI